MTTEYRYTDRDVRENPKLAQLAYDYLDNYGGDFEPVVKALAIFKDEARLPTNLIRVVLNCMRHDANVANDLPAPVGYKIPRKIAEVVKPRKRDWDEPVACELKESHYAHSHRVDDELVRCDGIPFEINRETITWTDAKVKVPFARARTGKLIHMLSGVGWCQWHAPKMGHAYGWGGIGPYLSVETLCRYPSVIQKPILMTEEKARRFLADLPDEMGVCPHCKEVAEHAACEEDALFRNGQGRSDSEAESVLDPTSEGPDLSETA